MTTQTQAATHAIDTIHSTAEFSVKHMMVSTVKGRFRDLEGQVYIDEADPTRSWVQVAIKADSVDTGVEMRDNDLRSDQLLRQRALPDHHLQQHRRRKSRR